MRVADAPLIAPYAQQHGQIVSRAAMDAARPKT
ncbi:MAG: hypothetical protein QOJ86_197 [Bradyrhizobium sp.]|jgi:hypothetical protein|nr:hypothetical protein [Bradyrhizobium sp.]